MRWLKDGWKYLQSHPLGFVLLCTLAVEKLTLLSLPPSWMLQWVHRFSGAPVLFFLALVFFGRKQLGGLARMPVSVDRRYAAAHVATLLALAFLQVLFYQQHLQPGTQSFRITASLWTACIPVAIATLLATFIPPATIASLATRLGSAWLSAAGVAVVLPIVRRLASGPVGEEQLWFGAAMHRATFAQCRWLFLHLYPDGQSVTEAFILGKLPFLVQVNWLCSGVEGLFIVAVLVGVWLVTVRREVRMQRAVLIVPIALLLTWYANILRVVALVAIGVSGHPQVAGRGFHAQAGWITLNTVALGSLMALQRVPWFRRDAPAEPAESVTLPNYAVVYLFPFVSVMAASLATQALSSGFEYLYPLRVLAALLALWMLRRHYRSMDWRFGWPGVMAGLTVAALWLGAEIVHAPGHRFLAEPMPALDAMQASRRAAWIVARLVGAVVTVPIVEELAFRGFLARRVVSPEFEIVPYARMGVLSLVISAAAFGALHGHMWAMGVVAGAAYWVVARMRNRLGEAVAAHAITNLVIAVAGLATHNFSLW